MTDSQGRDGPPGTYNPGDWSLPEPPRFDVINFMFGALITCILVAILGYGTILLGQAMIPPEEGVNIGAALLASFGTLMAIAVGSALTAWRGRRREGQPLWEGVAAGLVGFLVTEVAAAVVLFIFWEIPLFELVNVLTIFAPGVGAAFAGAALGNLRRRRTSPG